MGFLKILLVFLIIYVTIRLVWRFFGKLILAWLGKKAMERVQRSFQQQTGFNSTNNPFSKNQTSDQSPDKTFSQPREKKKVGEYVDFEEID